MRFNSIMIKIDRISAWILLICIPLFFISGFGLTEGVVDKALSSQLHLDLLPYVTIVSFVIHSGLGVRMTLIRWRLWNRVVAVALILLYGITLSAFFYWKSTYKKAQSSIINKIGNSGGVGNSQEKIFSKEELSKYNGMNGMPAYVAVDGDVYDLTEVFNNGEHYGHLAGQELSEAFYQKHVKSQIAKYPIVGRFVR